MQEYFHSNSSLIMKAKFTFSLLLAFEASCLQNSLLAFIFHLQAPCFSQPKIDENQENTLLTLDSSS